MWQLWKSWNQMIFNNHCYPIQEIIGLALAHFEDFSSSIPTSDANSLVAPSLDIAWAVPPIRRVKLNFDVATNPSQGSGAVATLARDHLGRHLGWFCKQFSCISNPLILEALACREACVIAKSKGLSDIIIEGNSQTLISTLHGKPAPLDIQSIINDILILSSNFNYVQFSFVRRCSNRAAHSLASKALKDSSFLYNPWGQVLFVTSSMPP
ncbi:hypothetical protein P3X46_008752 [Hevea brasiliensis]|uniref:RNase H type-1 domain-containing protein n=1 Tax=Hevea brasiliensis TaxID=3981 RepID=A0ABQ9MK52_HEVBR|nr:hypothetical protein P3X46_008752 [Hevea brasiliensis]